MPIHHDGNFYAINHNRGKFSVTVNNSIYYLEVLLKSDKYPSKHIRNTYKKFCGKKVSLLFEVVNRNDLYLAIVGDCAVPDDLDCVLFFTGFVDQSEYCNIMHLDRIPLFRMERVEDRDDNKLKPIIVNVIE